MTGAPTQAVMLAGGRGTRLRPLTDGLPKPLIPFHGRPFLAYLLEQLRGEGIERVLLLTGYLGGQIRHAVGDGGAYGLRVDYVDSPVEAETGSRLRDAAPRLDPSFLLLYCDNYWPIRLAAHAARFAACGAPALVTVYRNLDGYTRNNVAVDEDGAVRAYDSSRSAPGLNGVEIGYAILDRRVLDLLPAGNVSFERTVYPALAARRALHAVATHHRYYSIGSHERLPLTAAFLAPQRAVLLDRDGVLNVRPPKAEYVRAPEEFRWLPGSLEAMRLLKQAGHRRLLVTNQPGLARGLMTRAALDAVHARMQDELGDAACEAIYVCAHGWDEGCFCRKPNPGLLFQAQRDFHLDLTKTVYVGDDERDVHAGRAAGCQTALISGEQSLLQWTERYLHVERAGAWASGS